MPKQIAYIKSVCKVSRPLGEEFRVRVARSVVSIFGFGITRLKQLPHCVSREQLGHPYKWHHHRSVGTLAVAKQGKPTRFARKQLLCCPMSLKPLTTASLLAIASFTLSSAAIAAQTSDFHDAIAQAQAKPTARQILEACVQNRPDALPNPFVDVPATHWAFKAVLTMHYCGAYRQATPSSLIDRSTTQQTPVQSPQSTQ